MNASKRWAYHFARELNCIRCGKTHNRRLLFAQTGDYVDAEDFSLRELQENLDLLDVWCDTCAHSTKGLIARRVTSEGRMERKRQAATIATLRSNLQHLAKYDTYTYGDFEMSKKELLRAVHEGACGGCGEMVDHLTFFDRATHRKASAVFTGWWKPHTLEEIIGQLEQCVAFCPSCAARAGRPFDEATPWRFDIWRESYDQFLAG